MRIESNSQSIVQHRASEVSTQNPVSTAKSSDTLSTPEEEERFFKQILNKAAGIVIISVAVLSYMIIIIEAIRCCIRGKSTNAL